MNVRIGVSQSPHSEPDRSWLSESDLPLALANTPNKAGLELLPQRRAKDIREGLAFDALDQIFRLDWRRSVVVGIDKTLDDQLSMISNDVDRTFARNK